MLLGYNTNGFAHHRLADAVTVIAELGYRGLALTPDVNHDPLQLLHADAGLACVIETGARFLLDPRRKHQPTLLSPAADGRERRFAFLAGCLDLARDLGAEVVSHWSGTPTDDAPRPVLMARLVEECKRLADYAAERNVRLAFEPEPGMFIDTMDKFAELHARVNHPHFGLTLDVGHLVCTGELPIRKHIEAWQPWLWNVHIEDMKASVHDHLMFGEGEVDFADVFAGLRAIDYRGLVSVELSRHSHDAVNTARRAKAFLDPYLT